ncbi:MAG TPA: hypothetical protein VI432_01665 [Candidatus Paceibacterota bacterium]
MGAENPEKEGKLSLELGSDGQLRVNGHEVMLVLCDEQQENGWTTVEKIANVLRPLKDLGPDGHEMFPGEDVLRALLKNPHLIPPSWKRDAEGQSICVAFWGGRLNGSSKTGVPILFCNRDGQFESTTLPGGERGRDLTRLTLSALF